jgi:hypothetical protein
MGEEDYGRSDEHSHRMSVLIGQQPGAELADPPDRRTPPGSDGINRESPVARLGGGRMLAANTFV